MGACPCRTLFLQSEILHVNCSLSESTKTKHHTASASCKTFEKKWLELAVTGSDESGFAKTAAKYLDQFAKGEVPVAPIGVKLIPKGGDVPEGSAEPEEYTGTTWCQALQLASMEQEVVVIKKENVGCPAAAIALGLVDEQQKDVLQGNRKYTDLMSCKASPADFTNGLVYACRDTGKMEFALFGETDTGRYENQGVALKAIQGMSAIQPEIMSAAIAYPADMLDLEPNVVILPLKPKQALLAIQGLNYITGERFEMSTIGIRGVCADLTAQPYLEQKPNGSLFCLGARALGGWSGDLMAIGLPFSVFQTMVRGMAESAPGFPYHAYPS